MRDHKKLSVFRLFLKEISLETLNQESNKSVNKLLDLQCLENRRLTQSFKIKLLPSIPFTPSWMRKSPKRQIRVAYYFL